MNWNDEVIKKYSNQVYGHRTKTYQTLVISKLIERLKGEIKEREKTIQNLETEKAAQPNISLTDWNNDYSKRPTQDQFNKEVQAKINAEKDATSWKAIYELERDKVKQLETKLLEVQNNQTQLTTDLTNKNKDVATILTKWKAKGLNELSAGIQNALDKGNELEKEVKNKDDIISQKDKTIHNLELKNEKLTESYKKLIQHLSDARLLVSHLQKDLQTEKQDKAHIQKELDDALTILNKPKTEVGVQTDLTAEQITQMEKDLAIKKEELSKLKKEQLQEKEQKLQEVINLQTKLDMETKTKEELLETLSIYRSSWTVAIRLGFDFSSLTQIDLSRSREKLKRFFKQHGTVFNLILENVEMKEGEQNLDLDAFLSELKGENKDFYNPHNLFVFLQNYMPTLHSKMGYKKILTLPKSETWRMVRVNHNLLAFECYPRKNNDNLTYGNESGEERVVKITNNKQAREVEFYFSPDEPKETNGYNWDDIT